MPIVTKNYGTYVPTCDEFNSHWSNANDDRVANALPEITLKGGYTRANFESDRDTLDEVLAAAEGLENNREIATSLRDSQKRALSDRMGQFRDGVEGDLDESPYIHALPTIPGFSSAESKWLRPFDDMSDLWGKINADTLVADFTPPMLLRAGYTLAEFTADLAAMRTQFKAVTTAENNARLGRKTRDAMLAPIRARMLQYRKKISKEYGAGHPLFESLPDLYASSGGSTVPTTTFPYDFVPNGADVLLWFQMPAGVEGVTNVLMLEGDNEFFTGVSLQPGQSQQVTWPNVTIIDDVDEVVLRNADNEILATGERDEALPDPGP